MAKTSAKLKATKGGAKKAAAAPAKGKAESKPPKAADEKAGKAKASSNSGPMSGVGHNVTKVRQLLKPYYNRYKRLMDDQASENSRYNADKRVLFEDAAGDLGTKRRLVSQALKEMYSHEKQEEKEAEMDRNELSQLDTMRDALGLYGDTPLGQAAIKAAEEKPRGRPTPVANEDDGEEEPIPEPQAA